MDALSVVLHSMQVGLVLLAHKQYCIDCIQNVHSDIV